MLGYREGQLPSQLVEGRPPLVDALALQPPLLAAQGHREEERLDGLLVLLAEDRVDYLQS